MNAKQKFNNVKTRAAKLMEERPLETLAVAAMVVTATAKLLHSVTEARNSATWKQEVNRRERNAR